MTSKFEGLGVKVKSLRLDDGESWLTVLRRGVWNVRKGAAANYTYIFEDVRL